MLTLIKSLLIVAVVMAVAGFASSFSINDGDARGEASIGTGGIAVEGCNANVEVDVNGGDNNDNAIFDVAALDFVIQSILVDASRADGGRSDCADRKGKVWMQLMSGNDAYGPVLGPAALDRGIANFSNMSRERLLAGKVTGVHIMIEIGE